MTSRRGIARSSARFVLIDLRQVGEWEFKTLWFISFFPAFIAVILSVRMQSHSLLLTLTSDRRPFWHREGCAHVTNPSPRCAARL